MALSFLLAPLLKESLIIFFEITKRMNERQIFKPYTSIQNYCVFLFVIKKVENMNKSYLFKMGKKL